MQQQLPFLKNMDFAHSDAPDGRKCSTCSFRDDEADPVWQQVVCKHKKEILAAGVLVVRILCFVNTFDGGW